MKKGLIIIFILFSACNYLLLGGDVIIHRPNKQTDVIKSIKIGERNYISIEQFALIVFEKQKYKISDGLAKSDSTFFIVMPSSFFVAAGTNNTFKMLQMQMPAVLYKNTIYLPLPDILRVAIETDIINYSLKENELFFKKYSPFVYDTYDFDTFADPLEEPKPNTVPLKLETHYLVIDSFMIESLNKNLFDYQPNYESMIRLKANYRATKNKPTPNYFQIPDEVKQSIKKH